MLILALDQSSPQSSLAVLRDGRLLAERTWAEPPMRNQLLFSILPDVLRAAGVDLPAFDLFAIGLGPGGYSGLRMSLSAMRGLALPGAKPVIGVPSVEVLALDILREGATRAAIVGDARRNRLWIAEFQRKEDAPVAIAPVSLMALDDLSCRLAVGSTVATPDWARIGNALGERMPAAVRLIREPRCPRARVLGELALRRHTSGAAPLPLTPLYMHPPVFVEPRFPSAS